MMANDATTKARGVKRGIPLRVALATSVLFAVALFIFTLLHIGRQLAAQLTQANLRRALAERQIAQAQSQLHRIEQAAQSETKVLNQLTHTLEADQQLLQQVRHLIAQLQRQGHPTLTSPSQQTAPTVKTTRQPSRITSSQPATSPPPVTIPVLPHAVTRAS